MVHIILKVSDSVWADILSRAHANNRTTTSQIAQMLSFLAESIKCVPVLEQPKRRKKKGV